MINKISVIGAGSFGTSLAILLVNKGYNVSIWGRKASQLALMRDTRKNPQYLPGIKLPEALNIVDDMGEAIKDADIVLFAVPAQSFRGVFKDAMKYLNGNEVIVNVAKGIEKGSLLRLSQVAKELMPEVKYVALSGPSHAEEVAKLLPTTVAVASEDKELAVKMQEVFNTDRFRVYTNDDIVGVELGGSLKNIIALGAGISDGMGFGDNAKAAMMTRGITEMTRLGLAMGSAPETFAGLTGLGDLIVTCTSMHSRNRRCGILIGQGKAVKDAVEEIGMVVEGLSTAEAAGALAEKYNVEMPITQSICDLIDGKTDVMSAVDALMGRKTKNEMRD